MFGFSNNVVKATVKVSGMMCDHCRKRVEDAVKAVGGVKSCKADVASGTAEVSYDSKKTSVEQIVTAINGIGYEASFGE